MNIKYKLSFPNPHTHYVAVELHLSAITQKELNLKMAVWTPGSYLIREFQRNIDFVEVSIKNSTKKRVEKTDKNTWLVDTQNENELTIFYKVYCFEYSVRTNFVDDSHASLNGAATFLYIDGYENTNCEIEIMPSEQWNNISTSLQQKEKNKWIRTAQNLDELIDSPMEIGNHLSYFFDIENVAHEVAIYGKSNCNIEVLITDLKKIISEEIKVFGAHPCKNYVFIIHHTDNSYGGLEHLNSSVNHITRFSYDKENYQKAISLLAHEYFHLWNVKRIRPIALGPFNYQAENYTDLLWFFEGVTSYYDDYVCYRAGVTTQKDYLEIVSKNVNGVLNTAGIDTQTLTEASFDTWLKYYRKNENSSNVQISYYTKGAVVAFIFDIIIIDATNGTKCLDNVMQQLYENYIANSKTGITEDSLLKIFNTVSGIDFTALFQKYLHTTEELIIEFYTELLGISAKNKKEKNKKFLGLSTELIEGKIKITKLNKNYGAYQGGLSAEDELLAIDGIRATSRFSEIYANKLINDTIEVLVARRDILKTCTITLTEDKRKDYSFELIENPSDRQKILLSKWLGK